MPAPVWNLNKLDGNADSGLKDVRKKVSCVAPFSDLAQAVQRHLYMSHRLSTLIDRARSNSLTHGPSHSLQSTNSGTDRSIRSGFPSAPDQVFWRCAFLCRELTAVCSAVAGLSTCRAFPFCVCCSRLLASELWQPRTLGGSLRPASFVSARWHDPGNACRVSVRGCSRQTSALSDECTRRRIDPTLSALFP